MNVIEAAKAYVNKMIEESEPGMKLLLVDKETISIISMVYGQSDIQQKEVFLVERLDANKPTQGPSLRYLKCLVFIRPTQQNIELLCNELQNPKYGAYYIYFTNILAKADVKILAEHDEQEVVKEVQEYYIDFLAVNPHLFSLGIPYSMTNSIWYAPALQRSVQGLLSILLSLKMCPLIRYQGNSKLCKDLSFRIKEVIDKETTLFSFGQNGNALLLILDRRDDPITPLLNQWTYQAMVHELLTINNNRVNLSQVPGISKELSEVVLSAEQDAFYAENLFMNYGEIGQNIKDLMEQFQIKAKGHQKIESIADMKNFVETYPQFKKLSGNVSKHITVVGELAANVTKYSLLEVSEIEQEVVSQNDHSGHLQNIKKMINNMSNIRDADIAKLVMLYALRYHNQSNSETNRLVAMLKQKSVSEYYIKDIYNIIEYAGTHSRQSELLNVENAVKITKRFFKGLNGVENIYTQHKPLLHETLDALFKGRLKENLYPYTNQYQTNGRPQKVIVFVVGGVTYEESLTVHTFNKNFPGIQIILGGTTVHNSKSFLEEVERSIRNKHS